MSLTIHWLLATLTLGTAAAGRTESPRPAPSGDPQLRARVERGFGQLPLYFVENRGQSDPRVGYYVDGANASAYFTGSGVTFALGGGSRERAGAAGAGRWAVAVDFVGARAGLEPEGQALTAATVTGLATYGEVLYRNVWPGIDVRYGGEARGMEYTFELRPGADPRRIRMRYRGASSVRANRAGQLEVETPGGGFKEDRPYAYQEVDGRRVEVTAAFAPGTTGTGVAEYGFRLGRYDRSLPLVVDPVVLVYGGYIGGSSDDQAKGVAVDASGSAYVVGYTGSTEATFPVKVGPDLTFNSGTNSDAFVAKVDPSGASLVYCGYISGSSDDYAFGVAVDASRSAYVVGYTYSSEATFPVKVGPDLTFNGGIGSFPTDAFVAKVDPSGASLVYCGYIGGYGNEGAFGVAVDASGNAYVAGDTEATEATFPVRVGPDLTFNRGGDDAFVAKVAPSGANLVYCGYIGGSVADLAVTVAVDPSGSAYVAGSTDSDEATFPVKVGPDLTFNRGSFFPDDAFVAKIDPSGASLVYCGYIGGSGNDYAHGVAVDASGSAYVVGDTASDQFSFPVKVGPDLTFNGIAYDAFVAKVDPSGASLVYCGYIGGSGSESALGVAVDTSGRAYVAGATGSDEATFPVKVGPDLTFNSPFPKEDAFVAKVDPSGASLLYCGYIGGSSDDRAFGVTVDASGSVYVAGSTRSTEATFPVKVGPDLTYNGGSVYGDAFVARVAEGPCALAASPIGALLAAKDRALPVNIDLQWQPDLAANGYNVWYVADKRDIPNARQANQPPAMPVAGCASPSPAPGPSCADSGAVPRSSPTTFFYQVHVYCDATTEGP